MLSSDMNEPLHSVCMHLDVTQRLQDSPAFIEARGNNGHASSRRIWRPGRRIAIPPGSGLLRNFAATRKHSETTRQLTSEGKAGHPVRFVFRFSPSTRDSERSSEFRRAHVETLGVLTGWRCIDTEPRALRAKTRKRQTAAKDETGSVSIKRPRREAGAEGSSPSGKVPDA